MHSIYILFYDIQIILLHSHRMTYFRPRLQQHTNFKVNKNNLLYNYG